jgi:hypothetical protein
MLAGTATEREGAGMSDQTPPEGKPGGYGRSWVRYLIIYLIVAAVLYFLIWLLFLRDGGLYG